MTAERSNESPRNIQPLVSTRWDIAQVASNLDVSVSMLSFRFPWSSRTDIDRVASLVLDYHAVRETVPTPRDFAVAANCPSSKDELVQRSVKGILAFVVLPAGNIQRPSEKLKRQVADKFSDLIMFVGRSSCEQTINKEICNLPDLERRLLLENMGTPLKIRLNFPDIDECTEEQLAEYIVRTACLGGLDKDPEIEYQWPGPVALRRIEYLMSKMDEREQDGEIQSGKIAAILSQCDESDTIFQRLIQAAQSGNFVKILQAFFESYWGTRQWGIVCERYSMGISLEEQSLEDLYEEEGGDVGDLVEKDEFEQYGISTIEDWE